MRIPFAATTIRSDSQTVIEGCQLSAESEDAVDRPGVGAAAEGGDRVDVGSDQQAGLVVQRGHTAGGAHRPLRCHPGWHRTDGRGSAAPRRPGRARPSSPRSARRHRWRTRARPRIRRPPTRVRARTGANGADLRAHPRRPRQPALGRPALESAPPTAPPTTRDGWGNAGTRFPRPLRRAGRWCSAGASRHRRPAARGQPATPGRDFVRRPPAPLAPARLSVSRPQHNRPPARAG